MELRLYERLATRRTIREFSTEPVDPELTASRSRPPTPRRRVRNRQPWRIVVVSEPALRRQIRDGAEDEERRFYESRAAAEWLDALEPLGTDWHKPHLTEAPSLVVAGLATLTHTPSPVRCLNRMLDRLSDEKPIMVIAVGWAAPDAQAPDIPKKSLADVLTWR